VSVERLERSTNSLKGYCSAIELHARFSEKYSITPMPGTQALTFFTHLVTIGSVPHTRLGVHMSDIPKLTEAEFDIQVLKSTLPVIVDFTATWCSPCKMLDPIVTQLSQEWDGKVKFYKLDVDENSNTAMQYGVMGVPTLIIFVNGNAMQRLSGYQPKDRIVSKFGSYV
jgi:thioredoxin 1